MLRIWSWNVNGLDVWSQFTADLVDVVLLQEAKLPQGGWDGAIVPDPDSGWRTAGWNQSWRVALRWSGSPPRSI